MSLVKPLVLGTTTVGTGTVAVGGTHYLSLETFEDFLNKERGLPDTESTEWTSQQKVLKDGSEELVESLKKIKDEMTTDPENGNKLKQWCKDVRSWIFKSLLKPEDETTVANVKKYCIYKIRSKIGDQATDFSEEGQDTRLQTLADQIRTDKATDDSTLKFDEEREKGLREIRESTNETEAKSQKNKLKEWCKKNLDVGYVGESDNIFKIASKYCKKS